MAVRELLGSEAYAEAALSFLRDTDVRRAKAGVLGAGQSGILMLRLLFTIHGFFKRYGFLYGDMAFCTVRALLVSWLWVSSI